MKTVTIEISGTTPLLVHRFGEDPEQAGGTRRVEVSKRDPRTEAEKVVYKDKDGHFYFSGFSITGCMRNAGAGHKMRGSRKTLRFVVPSAVRILNETITILNGNGKPAENFEVDSRPVTIPATKGRVMRHRPRFDNWSAKFSLLVDDKNLALDDAHMLLNEGGQFFGVGDFRPEKGGPFGCFQVTKWSVLKDEKVEEAEEELVEA